ncbi:MAG: hypothetical protein JNN30_02050 [Rhodanobacteraceae bacterium]|nr:hypothetical protein [Rhodanobacteraceae bacterium]
MSRLTLALAVGTSLALAAVTVHSSTAPAITPPAATASGLAASPPAWRTGRGLRLAVRQHGPVLQTLRNLRELERLYLVDGRAQEIPALYREVLSRTENPAVRQFAYRRIARNEFKPGDAGKSIAALRQSLDENLRRLPQP